MRENVSVGVLSMLIGTGTLVFLPEVVSGETVTAIGDPYSPGFFPILIGALLIICGSVLAAGAVMGHAPASSGEGEIESPLRLSATAGFILAYTVMIVWIGMLAASVVCIAGLAYILGYRHHLVIAIVAIAVPALIHVLFERMLYVLLPEAQIF